jgi:zinc transporter 1/2/3
MTLALDTDEFDQLLVVLVRRRRRHLNAMATDASPACPQTFHQAFEGLGLGARLTFLRLPPSLGWVPFTCAAVYACATPLGMVIGLAARSSIDMSSTSATVVEGVLDSISAGILAYSACVQLIAQEVCALLLCPAQCSILTEPSPFQFVLNDYWRTAPLARLVFALACFATGAAVMSVLAVWA